MTKEEILTKEFDKFGGFVNVINTAGGTLIFDAIKRIMQEYADQETAKLREELAELKAKHKEDLEVFRQLIIEAYDLKEHCVDKGYIDWEDESVDGCKTFDKALNNASKIIQR